MYSHFFFDLDNTLTRSKSPILPEHEDMIVALSNIADVIIVSGSSEKNIWGRMTDKSRGTYYTLSQNGNAAFDKEQKLLWEHPLTPEKRQAIEHFIVRARQHTPTTVPDENDLIEDRGCQISFSFIGQNADIVLKERFDPDFSKRRKVLEDLQEEVTTLRDTHDLEVTIGGTTNFDIYPLGKNKGFNARELIQLKAWKAEDCVYIGDALFPGGNDETVVGIMPTHAVKNYVETYEYLSDFLQKR